MNVLLVDPYYLNGNSPPSWALGQLETQLEAMGFDVGVEDFVVPPGRIASLSDFHRLESEFIGKIASRAANADVVYITTSFGVPQKPTPILSRIMKILSALPDVEVVIGGAQIEWMKSNGLDVAAFFEDEARGVEVVGTYDNVLIDHLTRKPGDLLGWPASMWRRSADRKLRQGSLPQPPAPAPVFSRWANWNKNQYADYRAVLTSIGCRYGCEFCFESKQQFQSFEFASTLNAYLQSDVTRLAIEDSTILGAHTRNKLRAQLEQLNHGAVLTAYSLVGEIRHTSDTDLAQFRKAGIQSFILGVESPDAETLRLYHKHVKPDGVREAIAKLHGAEIAAQGCLMIGIPEMSASDTMATMDYALGLDLDVRRWHIFQPSMAAAHGIHADLSPERFAHLEVNVPSHVLPELFDECGDELLLEEHALFRALPHLDDAPAALRRVRYAAGYTLHDLFSEVIRTVKGTKTSFDEEDYYALLAPENEVGLVAIDNGSWLSSRDNATSRA